MDEMIHHLSVFVSRLWQIHTNELHNRSMHISEKFAEHEKADVENRKANIKNKKANIEISGLNVEGEKANIEAKLANIDDAVISKTKEHIVKLYLECGSMEYFGRSTVEQIVNLKSTRASELIKLMLEYDMIYPVQGHGKGKYCFK